MEHDSGENPYGLTSTEVIAARVRTLRGRRGWTAKQLAEAMVAAGMENWSRLVVTKLENGPRQAVTVDELLTLAYVLDVAPIHLMLPIDSDASYEITPNYQVNVSTARAWIRGEQPISGPLFGQDERTYFAERPLDEFGGPTGRRTSGER